MRGRIDFTPDGPRSATYVDRSQIVCEAYPGAANDIEARIHAEGGLVCEQHPRLPFEHDDCSGPGMTRAAAIKDGLL